MQDFSCYQETISSTTPDNNWGDIWLISASLCQNTSRGSFMQLHIFKICRVSFKHKCPLCWHRVICSCFINPLVTTYLMWVTAATIYLFQPHSDYQHGLYLEWCHPTTYPQDLMSTKSYSDLKRRGSLPVQASGWTCLFLWPYSPHPRPWVLKIFWTPPWLVLHSGTLALCPWGLFGLCLG